MEAMLIKTGNDYLLEDVNGETLAITSGSTPGRMLSLKNCQAIEVGYDLDELISKTDTSHLAQYTSDSHELMFDKGFKLGVQAVNDEFLQWFVRNPDCERVEVKDRFSDFTVNEHVGYKIIIPQIEFPDMVVYTEKLTVDEVLEKYGKVLTENQMEILKDMKKKTDG